MIQAYIVKGNTILLLFMFSCFCIIIIIRLETQSYHHVFVLLSSNLEGKNIFKVKLCDVVKLIFSFCLTISLNFVSLLYF